MSEPFAKLAGYLVGALLLIASGFAAAWAWQDNKFMGQLDRQALTFKSDLLAISNAGAAQTRQALANQYAAQLALAHLDQQSLKEKNDALAENERLRGLYGGSQADNARLRSDVITGFNRLRIAGRCSTSDSAGVMPAPTGAASLGDGGSVELAPAARQTVFDIRAGILADQAALKAAQKYITDVCLK